MSVPGNMKPAPAPSSFDDNNEFYEESRWAKLSRRIKEEPLIPLGCALTCWALFEATRSIRSGDKQRTNRMFRRRIYAQGFTVMAMLVGSIYWESDRKKRNEYDELIEDKKRKERHESWLKELEARDEEEQEFKRMRDKMVQDKVSEKQLQRQRAAAKDQSSVVQSVLEDREKRRDGPVMAAIRALWNARD